MDMTEDFKTKALIGYAERTKLRATVQLVPYIGGSLDMLLASGGTKLQQHRLMHFLEILDARLSRIEGVKRNSEDSLEFALDVIDAAVHARSEQKRELFANILANQVANPEQLEQAEMALRVIDGLDSIHFKVISAALQIQPCIGAFAGHKIVTISHADSSSNIVPLKDMDGLTEYPLEMLRYAASELVSRGLMRDEGIGRLGLMSMEYLEPTDTAQWLSDWVSEEKIQAKS